MRRVLFYRDFRRYSGGHQKVADYFGHCTSAPGLEPFIAFSHDSLWDESNPWFLERARTVEFAPSSYDLLFLGGVDWRAYLDIGVQADLPVINLVQGVRHADPSSDVYPFLAHKAIRICVSKEVADAILATGRVNGPVFTIPNGVNVGAEPRRRERDIFILGYKQPDLAERLSARLKDCSVQLQTEFSTRDEVLLAMATSRVTVVLPFEEEGFCLPAMESMHLSDVTVVPDCVGNRSFCENGSNCLVPDFSLEAIELASRDALSIAKDQDKLCAFREKAEKTVSNHSLQNERNQFLQLVRQVQDLWTQA